MCEIVILLIAVGISSY